MKAKAFKDLTEKEKVIRKNKSTFKRINSNSSIIEYSKLKTQTDKLDFIAKKLGLIK